MNITKSFTADKVDIHRRMLSTLKSPFITTRYETDKLIERIGYWVPSDEIGIHESSTPKTNLKIAAIVEERLYQGLRQEARMMLLTPHNWKAILKYSEPDFLLMESVWTTATGHWHMAQCPPSQDRNQLIEIISMARHMGIPTVFWMTKNNFYHEHYKTFASHFDFIYCADPMEAEILRKEGLNAKVLLPCATQSLYSENQIRSIPFLFDGWADIDKYTVDLNSLNKLKPLGLKIIESRYQIFRKRVDALPNFKDNIVGCVTRSGRLSALAASQCYITFEKSLSTSITQQWMSLEAVGLGSHVFHIGEIYIDDPRFSTVHHVNDVEQMIHELQSDSNNPPNLIDQKMTYADRLAQVENAIFHKEKAQ